MNTLHAEGTVELAAGDAGSARAHDDDAQIFRLAAADFAGVEQRRAGDDGGSVLVVMEDGDVHFPLELLFDVEAFGSLDVFKVDPAEGRLQRLHHGAEFVGIGLAHFKVKHVHVGKEFEQHALAFHDGLAGHGPDIAKPEDGSAVGDDSDKVGSPRVHGRQGRIAMDLHAGFGHAGGIGH